MELLAACYRKNSVMSLFTKYLQMFVLIVIIIIIYYNVFIITVIN